MKIYTKIILDKNYNILEEKYFEYNGPLWNCGIHYDFKSTRSAKLMEKQVKLTPLRFSLVVFIIRDCITW